MTLLAFVLSRWRSSSGCRPGARHRSACPLLPLVTLRSGARGTGSRRPAQRGALGRGRRSASHRSQARSRWSTGWRFCRGMAGRRPDVLRHARRPVVDNVNNLGDLPYHLQITASFAYGENFPPQNPVFAGVGFSYHYISDFLAALFVVAGGTLAGGMFLVTISSAARLLALVHRWTHDITGDRIAARFAPLLLVSAAASAGWGCSTRRAPARRALSAFLGSDARYTIQPDGMFRFGNAVTTLLIPQRGLLLGLAIAVIVFTILWRSARPPRPTIPRRRCRCDPACAADRSMVVAGLVTGVLPIVHLHTFVVVFGTAFFFGLLFQGWRVAAGAPGRCTYHRGARRAADGVVATRGSQANLALLRHRGRLGPWHARHPDVLARQHRDLHPAADRRLRVAGSGRCSQQAAPLLDPLPRLVRRPERAALAPWLWDNIKVLSTGGSGRAAGGVPARSHLAEGQRAGHRCRSGRCRHGLRRARHRAGDGRAQYQSSTATGSRWRMRFAS